ncbi:MAG TPA: lactonase family protein [Rectinemataceae bacterium]|nr:lactonase family protein [Rectinemataceae bacterium]
MLVFVGTYTDRILFGSGHVLQGKGEGIYVYRFDEVRGTLRLVGTNPGITNPSYLAVHPSRRFLYAVNELKEYEGKATGTVSAFALEGDEGGLRVVNKQLTHGTDPCHVVVDDTGAYAFVSNFMSGSVCVLPVRPDGSLGEASDFIQHQGSSIDPLRQKGPHAHAVTLDAANRFAFVPDLGLDKLLAYRFDRRRGMLEPNCVPWIKMKPGAGPRQVVFHPGGTRAYVVNELDSTVSAFGYDAAGGTFEYIETVSTLPTDYSGPSSCAEIQVSPSGRQVYASNRGHDSIAIFQVDAESGALRPSGHESTQGRTPRSFGIDPTGRFLLAANQDSDSVIVFRVDSAEGGLEPTGQIVSVPTPVCVKFF